MNEMTQQNQKAIQQRGSAAHVVRALHTGRVPTLFASGESTDVESSSVGEHVANRFVASGSSCCQTSTNAQSPSGSRRTRRSRSNTTHKNCQTLMLPVTKLRRLAGAGLDYESDLKSEMDHPDTLGRKCRKRAPSSSISGRPEAAPHSGLFWVLPLGPRFMRPLDSAGFKSEFGRHQVSNYEPNNFSCQKRLSECAALC